MDITETGGLVVIELETPYKEVWKKGYLRTGKDNRKLVDLVNWPDSRTTTSYARYLLSVQIGRLLTEEEEADHKDGDKTNDDIENLQVLTILEHRKKTTRDRPKPKTEDFICAFCQSPISRRKGVSKGENVFCSRACNAKYTRSIGVWTGKEIKYSTQMLLDIKSLREEGLSDYKIADRMGVSRSSIHRYRKLNNID